MILSPDSPAHSAVSRPSVFGELRLWHNRRRRYQLCLSSRRSNAPGPARGVGGRSMVLHARTYLHLDFRRARHPVRVTESDAPDRSSPAPVPAIGRAHAAARRAFSRLAPAWPGCTGSGRHQNLLRMPATLLVRNHFSACAASAVSVTNRSNNRSGRLAPYFPDRTIGVAVYVERSTTQCVRGDLVEHGALEHLAQVELRAARLPPPLTRSRAFLASRHARLSITLTRERHAYAPLPC